MSTAALKNKYDIIICGAGMIGATTALTMAKLGFSVALVDQSAIAVYQADTPPSPQVSALNYLAKDLLESVGCWNAITQKRFSVFKTMQVWEPDSQNSLGLLPTRLKKAFNTHFSANLIFQNQLGFVVENAIIKAALHEVIAHTPKIDFYHQHTISELNNYDNHITLRCTNGQKINGDLLIGADGNNSKVAKLADIGYATKRYPQNCLVATCTVAQHSNCTWQAFFPEGPRSFIPMADWKHQPQGAVILYHKIDYLDRIKNYSKPNLIQLLEHLFPPTLSKIIDIQQVSCFPLLRKHAHRYYDKNILLIGDAAHTIHPLAGQGANLGFADIYALQKILYQAKKKCQKINDTVILKNYETQRRKENKNMMLLMDLFFNAFNNTNPTLQTIRNIGLGVANQNTFLKKLVIQYASKFNYYNP